jgi:SagB-type dehydrogenase family enzyme
VTRRPDHADDDVARVHRYHDGTKHHFDRFAPSLGYLDWASQPSPFRTFHGAPALTLVPAPHAPGERSEPPPVGYDRLDESTVPPLSITAGALGYFLRHALGLSAWKAVRSARWSLRVNPSSGNLHPTEAYLVCDRLPDTNEAAGVWHYAPDRHAIERRCEFDGSAWPYGASGFLMALTSIHWRESWKYGERAFRYCQHDLGHAIAAAAFAAALCGWRVRMLPAWPHGAVARLVGADRERDYFEAEREEPACVLFVARRPAACPAVHVPIALLDAVSGGRWFGRASQLSRDHVRWSFIDEVAAATEDRGRDPEQDAAPSEPEAYRASPRQFGDAGQPPAAVPAAALFLRRRSALAFDCVSSLGRRAFMRMLARVLPGSGLPFDSLWWPPCVHLALFVHRVDDVVPGLYLLARAPSAVPRLRAALRREFLWEPVDPGPDVSPAATFPCGSFTPGIVERSPGVSAAIRTSRRTAFSASG